MFDLLHDVTGCCLRQILLRSLGDSRALFCIVRFMASMTRNEDGPLRTALILYGSETGNSQELADELGALVERLHFTTRVSELNAIKPVRANKF